MVVRGRGHCRGRGHRQTERLVGAEKDAKWHQVGGPKLHAVPACLNAGELTSIDFGIAKTTPLRLITALYSDGLLGEDCVGSGKAVTPCWRMHCET